MSCENPKRRQPIVNLLSREATRELINSLPPDDREIEFVLTVTKKGNADHHILQDNLKNGDRLVQTDTCEGKCFIHEVSTAGQCAIKEPRMVPCDSQEVKDLITNKVVREVNSIGVVIYENSGCACTSGGCLHT